MPPGMGPYYRVGDALAALICVLLLVVLAGYAWGVLSFLWG